MAFIPSVPAGAEVAYRETQGAPAAIPTVYSGAPASIDAAGHKWIAFFSYMTVNTGAATLTVQVEVSNNNTDWLPLTKPDAAPASGVETVFAYQPQIAAGADVGLPLALETKGWRYWRFKEKIDAGTSTGYSTYRLSGGPI